jgi:hypothetical protein
MTESVKDMHKWYRSLCMFFICKINIFHIPYNNIDYTLFKVMFTLEQALKADRSVDV